MGAPEAEMLAEQGRVLSAIQRIQDLAITNKGAALVLLKAIRRTAHLAIRKLEG